MGKYASALRDFRGFTGKLAILSELDHDLGRAGDFERVIARLESDAKSAQNALDAINRRLEDARAKGDAEMAEIATKVEAARENIIATARQQANDRIALFEKEVTAAYERAQRDMKEARDEVAFQKSEARRIRAEAKIKSDEMLASARREAQKIKET
jgi:F0F1-type ATP synthase membrane subunit b/b'